MTEPVGLTCNFCTKTQREVRKLIMGPGRVCICDECIGLCNAILAENAHGVDGAMCVAAAPGERAAIGEETER